MCVYCCRFLWHVSIHQSIKNPWFAFCRRVKPLPATVRTEQRWVYTVKLVCSLLNVLVAVLLINGLVASDDEAEFELVTEPVSAAVWLVLSAVVWLEYRKFVRRGRWILAFLYLFILAAEVVRFPSQLALSDATDRAYFFVVFCIGFACNAVLVLIGYFRSNDMNLARALAARMAADAGREHDQTTYLARLIAAGRNLESEERAIAATEAAAKERCVRREA